MSRLGPLNIAIALVVGGLLIGLFAEIFELRQLLGAGLDAAQTSTALEAHSARLLVLAASIAAVAVSVVAMLWRTRARLDRISAAIKQLTSTDKAEEDESADDIALVQRWGNSLSGRITDLQRRQRLLIDQAVDVICVVDIDGNFVWLSPSCHIVWGYPPEELIGRPMQTVLKGTEISDLMGRIVGASKSIDRVAFETSLLTKKGDTLSVVWAGHWSASEGGLFCIVHDVTAQKKAADAALESERRMRELLDAERELERVKEEFVAMITHDVRSPLTSVQGLLTLIANGVLGTVTDDGKRIAERVEKEIARLIRLLNDMLEVARMDSGEFQLECRSVDVAATCRDAIENTASLAAERNIELKFEGTSATCIADEQRIMQVLINLLSNAIKYAPDNSAVVVSVAERDGNALVSVSDKGRGIPEDKIATIFDKFKLVSPSDSKKKGGIGLGLAICKAIVNQHGGEIGVSSKLNEGSCFWFTIPMAEASRTVR